MKHRHGDGVYVYRVLAYRKLSVIASTSNHIDNNSVPMSKDGLSFSTIPPRANCKAVVTTIKAINSTGIVYAVHDRPGHVSVKPVGASVETWGKAGPNSIWTQAVKSVVIRWDGMK